MRTIENRDGIEYEVSDAPMPEIPEMYVVAAKVGIFVAGVGLIIKSKSSEGKLAGLVGLIVGGLLLKPYAEDLYDAFEAQ